jgi:PAS domain S-box-containing protein
MAKPRQQKIELIAILRYTLALLFLLFVAQTSVFSARLSLRVFTSADGLGSSYVSYGMRDSRDFLWFCTRDGLTRFDGQNFVTYRVGEKDAPPGVEQILEARNGVYWIATTGGLYRFDPNEKTDGSSPESERTVLHAKQVGPWRGVLKEDVDGNVWLGSDNLYRIVETDGNTSLVEEDINPAGEVPVPLGISNIYQSRDKSMWILTAVGIIRRLPDGREIVYRTASPRTDGLSSILEDSTGHIWVARASGIYVFFPDPLEQLASAGILTIYDLNTIARIQADSEKTVKLPAQAGEVVKYSDRFANTSVKYLYRSSDDHIWIANGNGAIEFDGKTFIDHTIKEGFLKGSGPMVEDSGGNLWFGFSTGVIRLDRHGFTTFDETDGLPDPATQAIGESPNGTLFVANGNYVVAQFDGRKFRELRAPIPAAAQPVWTSNAVFQDSAGEWWFLTAEKLYRFAATENILALSGQRPVATYDSHSGLRGDQAFHIFEDSNRNLWISNRVQNEPLQGLTIWKRENQSLTSFSQEDGYPLWKAVSSFAEDKTGSIWFGFYEGGLARYRNGRFEVIGDDNVPKGAITSLHVDRNDKLWVASSLGGLGIYDLSSERLVLTNFTIENGLASNNVRSLTEDDFGNIYAGTARGVDRISPDTTRVKHYSVKDGLAGDFVSVSYKARDGALWFGTPSGLSRLVPEKEVASKSPPVWISGLRVAGERRSVSDLGSSDISNLELSPGQSNLQIDFFGIDYNLSQPLHYQYKLEGADKDWSQPAELATVSYANLSPGSYRFMVRAINADGAASEKPAVIAFTLLPPVWQRWWFVGLVAIVVIGGVYALDRFRVLKTRQVESALARSEESETRYRTLAETASDAIITIDVNSRIVYANKAAGKIFGYEPSSLVSETLTFLMPDDLQPRHEEGFGNYLSTGRKNIPWAGVEVPGRHRDGHEIPLELSFGEFELQGERYFTGVARDISERKRAEEDLRRSREERFRELERVRMRIATDLHDDIGASLSQIALLSEVVGRQVEETETNGLSTHLHKISSVSTELVQAMGDIVWAINPRKDSLQELIKRMRRFASDVFFSCGIKFQFETNEIEDAIALGANIRREVFVIFKEAVNNIARHSGCRNVNLELTINANRLILELDDDGRGFDVLEKLSESFSPEIGGNGLINMKKRARELGGECVIESAIGKGSNIRIDIPLRRSVDGHHPRVEGN